MGVDSAVVRRIAVWIVLATASAAGSAVAQTFEPDPATVRVRIGPLWMNPRIELSNFGVDSNVFNEPTSENPKSDTTATISPTTDLWLRMGRSWLQVNIREDIVWYQHYASERSANNSYAINWHLPLNRLVVTLSPTYLNTRDRPGFEIDARAHRTEYGGKGLVEVRGFSRTFIGVNAAYTKVGFDRDAVFQDANLHDELNRKTTTLGVSVRHELTPLTTITFTGSQTQDRFDTSPLRDSNSTEIGGAVRFDPHALLKGGATIGYRNFRPISPDVPNFVGLTTGGDLSYTLLGATRFTAQFKRDVGYSYDVNQPYYLESGISGSIAQQVFGPVDVVGRAGASQLAYRDRANAVVAVSNRTDHIHSYGVGIGYHMGKDLRLGFNVDQQHRISEVTSREYDGLKYGTAVTYAF
jgi:putative beta-barrel porin BBP2